MLRTIAAPSAAIRNQGICVRVSSITTVLPEARLTRALLKVPGVGGSGAMERDPPETPPEPGAKARGDHRTAPGEATRGSALRNGWRTPAPCLREPKVRLGLGEPAARWRL